jgi:hypothetical protein
VLPPIYRGAQAYAMRLRARDTGGDVATISADETANVAMARAVAAIFVAEQKKRSTMAYTALGVVGAAGIGAGVVRKLKRR